jgi:hypothetical protein
MSEWIVDGSLITKISTGETLDTTDKREPFPRPRPINFSEAQTPEGQAAAAARHAALQEWVNRDPRRNPLYVEYLQFLTAGGRPLRADIKFKPSFEPVSEPAPVPSEVNALRDRIAQLEEQVIQLTPEPEPDVSAPPPEVLAEAQPDEDLVELKARLLGEFASLRNMLIGHIPMTEAQLLRLQALEHPKFQTWLQA